MRWLVALSLVFGLAVALDDDLQFEGSGSHLSPSRPSSTPSPVRRHWGVPDFQAVVGKLFVARIPDVAFSGDIDHYEPWTLKSRSWPRWLSLSRSGDLKGVPSSEDVGNIYLRVRAVGPMAHYYSKDTFAVEVMKPGLDTALPKSLSKDQCPPGVDPMMLTILMDVEYRAISPARRVVILETVAKYFGMPQELLYLLELTTPRDILSLADATLIMAGPGNVRKTNDKDYASLSFQVGCGREIRKSLREIVDRVRSDAKDGTLAEVLQAPVVGWHIRNELPAFFRDRREAGSGDFYGEEDDEEDYGEPPTTISTPHAHRHHHGEDDDQNRIASKFLNEGTYAAPEAELEPSEVFYHRPSTSLRFNYDAISTPPFIPERPTLVAESTVTVQPTRVTEIDLTPSSISPRFNPVTSETEREPSKPVTIPLAANDGNITELTSESSAESSATLPGQTSSSSAGTYSPSTSSSSSSSAPSSPRRLDTQTTPELDLTETTLGAAVDHTSTVLTTTEEIEPESRNFPPQLVHRLKKVTVTAGKVLRFKIPENTFSDVEDGSTSQLSISFKTMEGRPLPANSWITFNESAKEIIALPLEEHVSRWSYLVEARDRDNDVVSDTFEVTVQQHKGTRTVNHEFTLSLSVPHQLAARPLEWQLRIISALESVYNDTQDHLTVRSVSTHEPLTFTWTNDSLPRSYCPKEEIQQLLKYVANDDNIPSMEFREALGPLITPRRVTYRGIAHCEAKILSTVPPPEAPRENYAPVPRNQIDQINATAGQLLLYRVPEDTFYDPEDGGTRKLKMTLLNMDRTPLADNHWLQFDAKNQEFFGLPMDKDVRSQEYQLVCEDRAGLSANDGLLVVVRPRHHLRYVVQFNVVLGLEYETFINSAVLKRKFIEKLQEVFEDPSPNSLVIHTINHGSTVITWFNSSLPVDHCPEEDILRLRRYLISDNEMITDRFVNIMGTDFPVIDVGLEPAGACQGELTVHHKPEPPAPPIDESHPLGGGEDYLVTFVIPAAVIAVMLILAGLVACLLYRKRRAKMSSTDEDDRKSCRNKGIPVIFQDELDEKPEPENKNPVIMKEEKPPLPPPEYQRGHDGLNGTADEVPYQPPPPFATSRDSGRNSRPKPTPTYRKPPPYVPP